jgi:flavin reductase
MTVSHQEFRDAMARLGAAVNVVTTAGAAGRWGITASAVCSVTDQPPTLLVCLNQASAMNRIAKANGVLCVNTLCAEQQDLSDVFAGRTGCAPEDRFATGGWTRLVTGAPVLEAAMVAFDCRITDILEKGTHSVLFAEVAAIRRDSGAEGALIWFGRDYHPVGVAAD